MSIFSRSLLVLLLLLSGCSYYSFTGASVPGHLNTIAIPLAADETATALTGITLDEVLTDLLIERFVRQTRYDLETDPNAADALLEVRIERYRNEPAGVGGGQQASLNRVSVQVAARYVDRVEEEVLVERTFDGRSEYDPTTDTAEEAAQAALEQVAEEIFSSATSNW